MALFSGIAGIVSGIENFLGTLSKLIDPIKKIISDITSLFSRMRKLEDSIVEEINGWKNFKQDIRFGQRVIQLESAIQKTRDLVEGIPAAWHSIVDIFKQFKSQFDNISPESAAADLEAELSEGLETGGLRSLAQKFPKLAKAGERILGVLALILQGVEVVSKVIDDAQTIVDELKRLRLEIERLDSIFLQQGNKRKTIKLADGKTIKIRLGKLHQL